MSKLIMIDDDEMYHKISQLMVKEYSPVDEVISSTDAKATLEFLDENKENAENLPDYIFVDLNMPGYDGWDFLSGYQKICNSFRKAVQVYVVSSSIDPKDIRRSTAYTFVKSFIMKPLSQEFLHELIA